MYSYMYYYLYSDMYSYLRQHIVGGTCSISIIHNILVLPLGRTCLTSPPENDDHIAGCASREAVTRIRDKLTPSALHLNFHSTTTTISSHPDDTRTHTHTRTHIPTYRSWHQRRNPQNSRRPSRTAASSRRSQPTTNYSRWNIHMP